MRFKKYIFLMVVGLITLFALTTRLYVLGKHPAGLYIDEAAQGYSAYSLLLTGKDEFGKAFPIVFRSFTDFKAPVNTYLIALFIPVFGLNSFTVRFPSFMAGILTIPVLYFLVKRLTKNEYLSVLSSLLLAMSPWHILFGITSFESNVALFFLISGILAFYKGLENPKILVLSAILFALSIPSYHSERIIVPVLLIIFFIKYKKILLDKFHKKYFITGLALGFIISLPTLYIALTPGFLARATGLNIFNEVKQMPNGYIQNYSGWLSSIINASWFLSTREFLSLYFSYFSPRYMFYLGDYMQRINLPELSTFFLWQYPFYIYGIWILLKNKLNKDFKFLIITLLIISPIPAAITRDPYTTIRALPLLIPQIIIISLGIRTFYSKFKNKIVKYILLGLFVLTIIYSLFKLDSSLIILNDYYRAKDWDYGWQDVAAEIQKLNTKLPVIVDNTRADGYPELAFFLKFDPVQFQSENFEVSLNEYYSNLTKVYGRRLGNIFTRSIDWSKDTGVEEFLIGDNLAISDGQIKEHKLTLISEIKYPDGTIAYKIVKTNPKASK